MKENETVSMALEMERTGDYAHQRVYFDNGLEDAPVMKTLAQPPMIAYQTLLSWKLLGENVWAPRLFNVVFGLLSVALMYYIGLSLFREETIALFCAFLLAIMPLAVFFSRNIQAESPAFFFMLLGTFFYLKSFSSHTRYSLVLGGLAFSVAWLYKPNFLFGILPLACCLDRAFVRRQKKGFLRSLIPLLLPYTLIVFAILWSMLKVQWRIDWPALKDIRGLFDIFTPSYWHKSATPILWYLRNENYTVIYSTLAALGAVLAVYMRKGLTYRYCIGWVITALLYGIFFSAELPQTSFSQMPFVGFVCISSASAVAFIGTEIKRFFKKDLRVVVMVAVAALSVFPVYDSLRRMHGIVFVGADVAGESLREFTSPGERVFLLTHPQGNAVARYAQRYMGWPTGMEDFKEKEKKFKIRYLCIFPAEFFETLREKNAQLPVYIEDNYSLKEVGLNETRDKVGYLILERGKGQSIKDALQGFSGKVQPRAIYKLYGRYIFYYSARPAADKDKG